jgi:hypothetical protein
MDALPVPHTPAANAARNRAVELAALGDEEIPLGWECANPALQIETWGVDDVPPLSGKS